MANLKLNPPKVPTPDVAGFVASLRDAGLRARTLKKYRLVVSAYLEWKGKGDIEREGEAGARAFLRQWESPATRAVYAAALRSWWAYSGGDVWDLTGMGRVEQRPPSVLLHDEDDALWQAAAKEQHPAPRLLLALLRGSGLRLHEVVGNKAAKWDGVTMGPDEDGLRIGEVDLEAGVATVRGKGRTTARLLTPEAIELIRQLIPMLPRRDPDAPLFQNRTGGVLGVRAGENMFRRLVRRAKIVRRVTPHRLRHTFASRFLEAGGDVRALQRLMGHGNIESTLTYADYVELKALRRVFNICNRLPEGQIT